MLAVAVSFFGSTTQGTAASLRSKVELRGETVRLSDLFANLQPGQDCEIGPAPAPGQHIVVPPPQLAAIASEFGVDWQSGPSYQAVTLARLARVVSREEILAVLRPALMAAGAPAGSEVSLAAFTSPQLPVEVTSPATIQTLDYDPQNDRFSALVLFGGSGVDAATLRVVGRAEQLATVVTLSRAVKAGEVLSATDLQVVRLPVRTIRGTPIVSPDEAIGLSLLHSIGPGGPLLREMLAQPMLVERGRSVVLKLESLGMSLTAAGTALEPGAAGDRIHVVNSFSHAVLIGQVMRDAEIQVEPGSGPVAERSSGRETALPRFGADASRSTPGWAALAQEAQN